MRIAVVANTAWYFVNFRLNLMRVLIAAGHEVVAVAQQDTLQAERLRAAGLAFLNMTTSERSAMGKRGRFRAESEFDEQYVLQAYLHVIHTLEGMPTKVHKPFMDPSVNGARSRT